MSANLSNSGGSGDHRRYRKRSFTDINVTPMVDVMLVLLIIFMVTAPMLTAGIQVDLPESKAAPMQGQDEPLNVFIKADKKVYLQERPIALEELGAKIKAVAKEKKETRIFVRGDRNVDYGYIMRVVGEINGAGYTKIALVTTEALSKPKVR